MDLSNYKAQWVELSRINFGNKAFQFRQGITEESVKELAVSMSDDGQKFPIILWNREKGIGDKEGMGGLQLVSGYRRVTAAKSMGWEKVLSIVIPENELSETEALRFNFIENIERKTLNNLDMMFACKKLKEQGKTNVDIGRLIGKDEKQVRRYIMALNNEILGQCPTPKQNSNNIYVKSTRFSFIEKLKIEPKPENTPILEAHLIEVKRAWKEALKKAEKQVRRAERKANKASKKMGTPEIPRLDNEQIGFLKAMQEKLFPAQEGSQQPESGGSQISWQNSGLADAASADFISNSIAQMEQVLNMPNISEEEKAKIREVISQMRKAENRG